MNPSFETILKAAQQLREVAQPLLAIQLGTGLSHAFDSKLEDVHHVAYTDIFPSATPSALSHRGELTLGHLNGCAVAVFAGRLHLYEGHSAYTICQNVVLAKLLGCKEFISTNAAGALNKDFRPGNIVMVNDHLNLTGENPLIGLPSSLLAHFKIEHPFVDMSQSYDRRMSKCFLDLANKYELTLHSGVYAGLKGPSLETSAERRMLTVLGADTVGMSTVNEIIMARYLGLDTSAFCTITNMATGGVDQQPDDIETILKYADQGGVQLTQLIGAYCDMRSNS